MDVFMPQDFQKHEVGKLVSKLCIILRPQAILTNMDYSFQSQENMYLDIHSPIHFCDEVLN
jgi:hypothetical protein